MYLKVKKINNGYSDYYQLTLMDYTSAKGVTEIESMSYQREEVIDMMGQMAGIFGDLINHIGEDDHLYFEKVVNIFPKYRYVQTITISELLGFLLSGLIELGKHVDLIKPIFRSKYTNGEAAIFLNMIGNTDNPEFQREVFMMREFLYTTSDNVRKVDLKIINWDNIDTVSMIVFNNRLMAMNYPGSDRVIHDLFDSIHR